MHAQEDNGAEGDGYMLTTGTVRRKTRPQPLSISEMQQECPMTGSPRFRVAFNRETSCTLGPQDQSYEPENNTDTQLQQPEQQEQPQTLHHPQCFETDMADANTTPQPPTFCTRNPSPLSPKTTPFSLHYQKPALYRAQSGFDDETAQSRHFARQMSHRNESTHRRRTPQKVSLDSLGQDAQRANTTHELAPEWKRSTSGGGGMGGEDERGRRRRRIGSEVDHEMADA